MENHKDHWYWEGDARRCPAHPNIKTSSPCGMFDAPCGQCEHDMAMIEVKAEWEALTPEGKQAIITENDRIVRERKNKYVDSEIPF